MNEDEEQFIQYWTSKARVPDDGSDALIDEDSPLASADDGSDALIDKDSPLASAEELASRVRRLAELRAIRDQTKLAADNAKKEFDAYQAEFFDEYERSPLKGSVTLDLGGDFGTLQLTPVRTAYARILNREAAEAYFRERAQDKQYVKEDFRMGRLHELVRECLEKKQPLPPGLDFYTKEYFRMTEKD